MSSHRADQVGSVLKRAIQERLLRGLADPRVRGLITVTRVKVAPDLRTATVFVSVTPESEEKLTMHGLKSAEKHIRHQIADRLTLPKTPHLTFKLDESLKTQSKVLGLISQGMAELQEKERAGAGEHENDDETAHENQSRRDDADSAEAARGSEKSK